MSRSATAWVSSSRRSASVDLPWSMCATMQKFRMWEVSTRPSCYEGSAVAGRARPPNRLEEPAGRTAAHGQHQVADQRNQPKRERAKAVRTSLKTSTKKVRVAVAAGDADDQKRRRSATPPARWTRPSPRGSCILGPPPVARAGSAKAANSVAAE